MKTHFFCIALLNLFLLSCNKDENKSQCHTCSKTCKHCDVYDNYSGPKIYSETLCGSATDLDAFETGLRATYSLTGDFVSCGAATPDTKEVCGTPDETNAAIATYTIGGYTCN